MHASFVNQLLNQKQLIVMKAGDFNWLHVHAFPSTANSGKFSVWNTRANYGIKTFAVERRTQAWDITRVTSFNSHCIGSTRLFLVRNWGISVVRRRPNVTACGIMRQNMTFDVDQAGLQGSLTIVEIIPNQMKNSQR